MNNLYLAHWGILGQKWGVRRYQNKDGSLTAEGKQRYVKPRHVPSEARKKAIAEEKARKFEETRKKVLATGNATEVLKYKNYSTKDELQAAYNRIDIERKLSEISAKETAKGKSAIDKIIDSADNWRARGEKAINVWNLVAKVHNSLVDEDDAWQKIGEKSVAEQKAERHKEKQEKLKKESREKMLVEYVRDYGDYSEIVKYLDKMSKSDAKYAINRVTPKNDPESRKKEKLITEYLIKYGSGKKLEARLPEMSVEELEELLKEKAGT